MTDACTTDADCTLATADWCTLGRTCDNTLGFCVTWPRCQTPPWLGCSNTSQQCVEMTAFLIQQQQQQQPSPWEALTPTALADVVIIMALACLGFVFLVTLGVQGVRRARKKE